MLIEKILALLVAKFAGVRKDGLALMARQLDMQVTTEAEAQALVDKITVEKVTEFVKTYRADVDKEISTGIKTNETKLKEKFDFVERNKSGDPDPDADPTDPKDPKDSKDVSAMIIAAVSAAVKPLQEQISSINNGKVNDSRKGTLETKLKDLPENFKTKVLKDFSRMNFESDEKFTEYLTETDTDITALKQELADSGLGQQGRPAFGQQNKDGVSQATLEYLKSKEKDADPMTGKELKTK